MRDGLLHGSRPPHDLGAVHVESTTSSLTLEEPSDLQVYMDAFTRVRAERARAESVEITVDRVHLVIRYKDRTPVGTRGT